MALKRRKKVSRRIIKKYLKPISVAKEKFVFIPTADIATSISQVEIKFSKLIKSIGKLITFLIRAKMKNKIKNQGKVGILPSDGFVIIIKKIIKTGRKLTRTILTKVAMIPVSSLTE